MTTLYSALRLFASRGLAALCFIPLLPAQATVATDPVGYIVKTAQGGSVSYPGMTFVSPALVNPVEWQGQVSAVNGATLTVANTDWPTGQWDSRYCLEVVSGPHAGIWMEIVSAAGDQLTVADPADTLFSGNETVRIRRFTTLSDFLGANNEAGLKAAASMARADQVTVYHIGGSANYWYCDGSMGGVAGWYDSAWSPAGDVVIAPGEGVILRRKTDEPLALLQVGMVKTGKQSIMIVEGRRNIVGGVTLGELTLGASQLYSGNVETGVASGASLAQADAVVLYNPTRTYWYYNGTMGGHAGWYDSAWKPADDVVIPIGATFAIDRKGGTPFVWTLSAFAE